MIRASDMGPLPALLEERESRKAVERVFGAESIPLGLIEQPDYWIPHKSLTALFERAAQATGDAMFGLNVGLGMTPDDYGLWAHYSSQATCLGDALKRIVKTLHFHEIGTQMRIAPRPDGKVAWEYWLPGVSAPLSRHYTDHIVPGLLQFVQGFLGPDWRPCSVEVGYPAPQGIADLENASDTPWVFDRMALAIVFPSDDLDVQQPSSAGQQDGPLLTTMDLETHIGLTCMENPIQMVGSVISTRLLDGCCDIEGTAEMLGIGCRTLQRQLEAEGHTYRSLVTRFRMDRAKCLIKETDASLKLICFELGYSDPAHFTRAFTRYFGHPPSALRMHLQSGWKKSSNRQAYE